MRARRAVRCCVGERIPEDVWKDLGRPEADEPFVRPHTLSTPLIDALMPIRGAKHPLATPETMAGFTGDRNDNAAVHAWLTRPSAQGDGDPGESLCAVCGRPLPPWNDIAPAWMRRHACIYIPDRDTGDDR